MLLFQLEKGNIAIDTGAVEGVLSTEHIHFLPQASPPVRGVITHRTELIAILDIERLLWDKEALSPYTVVVMALKDRMFGICLGDTSPRLVDRASCTSRPTKISRHFRSELLYGELSFGELDPEALYNTMVDSFR